MDVFVYTITEQRFSYNQSKRGFIVLKIKVKAGLFIIEMDLSLFGDIL